MYKSFEDWIFSFKKPFGRGQAMVIALISLAITIISLFEKITKVVDNIEINYEYMIYGNIAIHFLILIIFLIFPIREFTELTKEPSKRKKLIDFLELKNDADLDDVYGTANVATSEFLFNFKRILWAWLFLYVTLIFNILCKRNIIYLDLDTFFINSLEIFFNNLATLYLILGFIIISIPAKDPKRTHIQNKDKLLVGLIVITILDVGLRIACYFGNWGVSSIETIDTTFYMLSGCIGSIATAQLIGRLDSKLIAAKQWVLVALYTYAAIQPFFTLFKDQSQILATILYLALFLKIVFVLFIYWLLTFNKLFYYLIRVSKIHNLIASQWDGIQPIIDDPTAKKKV